MAPKAKAAIAKAREIDDELSDVHAEAAGVQLFYDFDLDGARHSLDHALELDPDNARAHATYGLRMLQVGRQGEGLDHTRKAQELDPLSPVFTTTVGKALMAAGNTEAARTQVQAAVELGPEYFYASWLLAETYTVEGRQVGAIRMARDYGERAGADAGKRLLAIAYADLGRLAEGRDLVGSTAPQNLLDSMDRRAAVASGDLDAAFALLERMGPRHSARTPINFDPLFAALRADPRYLQIRREAGIPE